MDEKTMVFDRKKHICYSPLFKKVIRERLSRQYPPEKADAVWERIQLQYVDFLRALPDLGGKKSTHNGTGGTYDCIALFAYYEVLEDKPTTDEFYETAMELLIGSFEKIGKIINANRPLCMRILHFSFQSVAKKDQARETERPDNYIMRVEPFDKRLGVRYRFEKCPIADFAKKHGYLHLMPALCNGDYPLFEAMHSGLIRRHTCANGDVCDYWIVGSESEFLKEHPRKTDKDGYWYNE